MCKLESILTHSRPDGTPISSLKRKLWYGSVFKSFEIVIVWSKFAQKWQEILYSISVVCKNSPFIYLNLTFFFFLGDRIETDKSSEKWWLVISTWVMTLTRHYDKSRKTLKNDVTVSKMMSFKRLVPILVLPSFHFFLIKSATLPKLKVKSLVFH